MSETVAAPEEDKHDRLKALLQDRKSPTPKGRATRPMQLCLDTELSMDLEDAETDLAAANEVAEAAAVGADKRAGGKIAIDPALTKRVKDAEKAVAEAEAAVDAASVIITFAALKHDEYDELLKAHPPREGHELDTLSDFNRETFPDVRTYHRAWPNHVRLYGGPGPIDAVLHGDLHYGNVLSSDRDGWLAIDPKGVSGEPCYEVGDLFRNRVDELYETSDPVRAMRRRVEALADLTGFDRERIRLWALAQAVLSEVWTADDVARAAQVDLRAARLLHGVGRLG